MPAHPKRQPLPSNGAADSRENTVMSPADERCPTDDELVRYLDASSGNDDLSWVGTPPETP